MSEKLYKIISRVFNVDYNKINDETSPENLEEWDSFNFYVLLDEIENEFNIKFDLDETLDIKKIGDLKNILTKRGGKIE
ncbi:acyl carrier protein [Candidatus Nitrosopelagicus brevis]|uniref:Acyl carrier protein n=1 Tax=Candidatus Nitrosopelagicus brevis TaxID=1410606 RepID=A0A0A7V236_9ARCH|nr:acyl carrier protein [Candidatus Nitrosopelagicus brevis]AJA92241.1 phosphopantetheine attachment domain protein [Candidatus Nitrosopelagicus brevis]MAR69763.1 acyl carrier protein [Nitrospina sp.]PTL87420.1 acyl carrier protein [Candidatus Nitrosopelagicus brevis]|tara:strand:- start:7279 stop:7515 length:237 start_codon:yes stop_codon:yes gene_type:complete